MESHAELYARHMLFLNLILEPQEHFGLQGKGSILLSLVLSVLSYVNTSEILNSGVCDVKKCFCNSRMQVHHYPVLLKKACGITDKTKLSNSRSFVARLMDRERIGPVFCNKYV